MIETKAIVPNIINARYDALCETMDLEFFPDGQVWRFYDVPEHVWYDWRRAKAASAFFCANILGRYTAKRIGTATN